MRKEDCYEEACDEDELRECGNSCSHYDELNCCCWVVTEQGIYTSVSEGDYCLYGLKREGW